MEDWKRRLSGMQATNTNTKTKNENEILKLVKPEILKTEFLKVNFKNSFLKAEQQALQQVLAKHQQQQQKSRMKGGSSFASKYQAGPSVGEVPNSQGGVRQHLLRGKAGEPNAANHDFCLAWKAV